jgi:PBP4 family serine-type D-alanyl-D-alanine carboxypeptidase
VVRGTGAVELTARYTDDFDRKQEILRAQLDDVARRIQSSGIARIRGNVVVDGSAWSVPGGNGHYPSAGSVTFNENTVEIQVAGAKIRTIPENVLHFKLVPQNSGPRQEKALANGVPTDRILINTTTDSTDYWRIDTISAEEYYRQNIVRALSQRGIAVAGAAGAAGAPEELLFTLEGIPVSEYVYRMFTDSDNLRAELLFLNLGYIARGRATYENASAACADLLREHKILPEQGSLADGSGLSRDNRISAKALARLLRFMSGDKNREAFRSSLAVSGLTGTLKNKFSAQELTGKIHAKSGTLDDVLSLSGFAETEKGEAVFSFIANNVQDKRKIWQLYEKILLCMMR